MTRPETAAPEGRHYLVQDVHRSFVVFNDDGDLTMEPLGKTDLVPVVARGGDYASAAWSADCYWYFVVMDTGIALLNVFDGRGLFCRKRSAMFFDWFLKAPIR